MSAQPSEPIVSEVAGLIGLRRVLRNCVDGAAMILRLLTRLTSLSEHTEFLLIVVLLAVAICSFGVALSMVVMAVGP